MADRTTDDAVRVLLVEDDVLVRDGAATMLRAEGYDVRAEVDGTGLDRALEEFRPDLALLDISLPAGPDGFGLAESIRAAGTTPIVFITARDDLDDRIRGLDLGADDYLVKPFSMRELAARIRAVLRRTAPALVGPLRVRDVTIDLATRTVARAGEPVALTPTEFDLLATMARTPGEPWSKRTLLETVWGFAENSPHLVEVQISGLRRKLEVHGPRIIITCRDGSYMVSP